MALTWVLTQLRAGDELGSFPGHTVPAHRNLELLYRVTPKEIAAQNGVDPSLPIKQWTQAIEGHGGMVQRAGSKTFTGVRWLVDGNVRLKLPLLAKPPRTIIGPIPPQPGSGITAGDVGIGLGGLALVGGVLWALFGGD